MKSKRHGELLKIDRDFITKAELAIHLGCAICTIDGWIAKGTIPGPHSQPGIRHAIWLRRHYVKFRDTGRWPKEAYHSA